jgi:hypothetical protein
VTLAVAATSTNVPVMSAILFAGIILFVTVRYALKCWVKPFTACHRCDGTGTRAPRLIDRLRRRIPRPRALRGRPDCGHCRGTGLRLRIGRRVFNHFRRIRRVAG